MSDKENIRQIRLLAGMLDDEDEDIAVEIMAELLDYGNEIEPVLAELQDSDNPQLRKRVQQLETILLMRRRRKEFSELLAGGDVDLEKGLTEVHLQWYDNDNERSLHESYSGFMKKFSQSSCRRLADAVYLLNRADFRIEPESSLEPDLYCIGAVLDSRRAAGSVMAVMVAEAGRLNGLDWAAACGRGEFMVYSAAEQMVLPMRRSLRVEAIEEKIKNIRVLKTRQLLLYFSMTLFSHSILSDNFRYIHTIGQSLCGAPDGEGLDFLPYPYCPAPEDGDDPASSAHGGDEKRGD